MFNLIIGGKIMTTDLFSALANLSNGTFVSVISATEPKLLKRGNPLAGAKVVKLTKAVLQFGYSYENAVNNRIEKINSYIDENDMFDGEIVYDIIEKPNFEAEGLPWGSWVEGFENKIIEHKGELYARFYEKKNDHREVIYLVNGEMASDEEIAIIKQFTPKSYSNRQAEVGIEDYADQVKPRTYKFSSIVSLKCGAIGYQRAIEVVGA